MPHLDNFRDSGSAVSASRLAVSIAAAVGLVAGMPASAQVLEEIVVTAQKRSQSIQDVPLAISALSGDALRDSGLSDAKAIVDFTPGLAGGGGTDSGIDTISIRGITSNDFGIGGDPSIAMYKNGVYSGRGGEVLGSFFDIDRIEILRGPQGLLFGRSAASGAIHQITNTADSSSFDAEVAIGGGERGQLRGDLMLNMPISEEMAVRLAYTHSEEDGYMNSLNSSHEFMGFERDAVRLTWGYENENLRMQLMGEYEDRQQTPYLYPLLDENRDPVTGDEYTIGTDIPEELNDHSTIANVTLNVDYYLEGLTFTSITGYRNYDWDYLEDFDGSDINLLKYAALQSGEYVSQEFRLVSEESGKLDWFLGASAYLDKVDGEFAASIGEEAICNAYLGASCGALIPGFTPSAEGIVERGTGNSETQGAAVYGSLTYQLTDQLSASLGLRYSYDRREFTLSSSPVVSEVTDAVARLEFLYPFETLSPVETEESWSYLTPRILLEYTPNEDWMLYTSVTQGTKPGAFNTFGVTATVDGWPSRIASSEADVESVDEEWVTSYEAGAKGSFLDNLGTLNLSLYYYDYEDLQQYVVEGVTAVVRNVGAAKGYGAEMELTLYPHEYLDLRLGAAWAGSEIQKVDLSSCTRLDGQSCEGNTLPFQPEITASGIIAFHYPIANSEIFVNTEVLYTDDFNSSLANDDITQVDARTEVNLRAGAHIGTHWKVGLFLENAFDKSYRTSYSYSPDLGLLNASQPSRPRTWGADVRYTF